ncbi:MAG TPA: penicillin acylase family protein [Vicinamibacterales bacterium]
MKKLILLVAFIAVSAASQPAPNGDVARWEKQAQNITIVRDDWGIPHVYGKTDADAVFGVMYAQAEDDFNRVETNYLNSIGRLAEAEGEAEIYKDLRMKLFIDPAEMKKQYEQSPAWLKALMDAYADGLNYYLYKHPETKPRVIAKFEPWMPLSFSEGSIGGDIESINLRQLESFYSTERGSSAFAPSALRRDEPRDLDLEPRGSNGVAIAPSNTVNKKSLLLINPHTSFFFRAEAQMVSEEGLNAYGALTWGQFFIYQGFNDRLGWMHTSSGVDNIDEYAETIVKKDGKLFYKFGAEERPVQVSTIEVPYKTASGMATKTFTVYRTHHGPIVREADGKWISVRLMNDPMDALTQSYGRTKARSYAEFTKFFDLHTNSSNNTIYADADGNIAYFHSNFIPKRNPKFDWSKPVDGSDPATEWGTLMSMAETPSVKNPASGWLYNSNNWPWSAAGPNTFDRAKYPSYVDRGIEESPRGKHALKIFPGKKDFTVDSLVTAAYDSYLPAFAEQIPVLVKAWDATSAGTPLKDKVAEQIAMLRTWDYRWGVSSVPTSLAVYWGEEIARLVPPSARRVEVSADDYAQSEASRTQYLQALANASDKLTADFGTWKTAWGEINRFQRLTGDIVQPFNDAGPSIPVGFTSAQWGSLASFGARTYPGTKKRYGTSGNSFVAVVEFGDRIRARAVTAGGESGRAGDKHFNDQAPRYATGDLREVYFYREQLKGHTEREYHPGR